VSAVARQQPEPEFQVPSEFYEVLLRIKRDQRLRYAREVSIGLQVRVERYAEAKRQHEEREVAR
jgi:hypothetical protein